MALGLGGCGQPHEQDVLEVASAFYDAHRANDGVEACSLLAPRTLSELERSAGEACARALLEEDLPPVSSSLDTHVFGTQAEVVWDGESTFLARFPDGWKVMAAACTPLEGHPYDCEISGG